MTPDKKVLVYFTPGVVKTFMQHRQRYHHQNESGGILLGRRRGRHFEVSCATVPTPKDKRTRTSFVRESDGHQRAATDMWKATHGEVDYLGEWHSHPESIPSPSVIDRREWRRLTTNRESKPPLGAAIVGSTSLFVGLLDRSRLIPLCMAD